MRAWAWTAIAMLLCDAGGVVADEAPPRAAGSPTPAGAPSPAGPPRPGVPPAPAGPIDLDVALEGAARLAEAAGACAPSMPAYIAIRCRSRAGQPARDFRKRYRLSGDTVADAAGSTLRITVPTEEAGKGLLIAPLEPQIHCDGELCLFAPSVTLFVRPSSPVEAARVASVTFSFRVTGMWRVRAWWGPRPTGLTATLWDAQDRRLGEGAVLQPTPTR